MQKLNIPIQSHSARRYQARVVWIPTFIAIAGILAFLLFSLWITRDTISKSAPEGTVYTLRFEKTARTSRVLNLNEGGTSLNPVLPWTMNDLIGHSNREFALHFDESGLIAISFDKEAEEKTRKLAESVDSQLESGKNRTTISLTNFNTQENGTILHPFSFLPWNNGYLRSDDGHNLPIRLTEKAMTIRGSGIQSQIDSRIAVDATADPFAVFEVVPGSISSTSQFYHWTGQNISRELFEEISRNGALIILAEDDLGTSYSISIPTEKFTIDELLSIARDMMARKTLTTTALTSETGEKFEEIRVNDEHLESRISAEEDFSYILTQNDSGDVLRISKTDFNLIISNRDISAEISEFSPQSSCNIRAKIFIKRDAIEALFTKSTRILAPYEQALFTSFHINEIAISRTKTRLCW